jgi:hypothetical protein
LPDTFDDKLEQDGDDVTNENKIKTNENLDEDEIIEDQPVTLKLLFKSITKMPKELVMLLVCQFCGWLAFFTCEIFFTDFVGQVGSFIYLISRFNYCVYSRKLLIITYPGHTVLIKPSLAFLKRIWPFLNDFGQSTASVFWLFLNSLKWLRNAIV